MFLTSDLARIKKIEKKNSEREKSKCHNSQKVTIYGLMITTVGDI